MEFIMKLFSIMLRHCGPKSCVDVIHEYVVADSEIEVLNYVIDLTYGTWLDRHNEDGMCKVYDEDYNIVGEETYLNKMYRIRGEFHNEDADYSDAYYGIHHWGWNEGVEISHEQLKVLQELKMNVTDIRAMPLKEEFNTLTF